MFFEEFEKGQRLTTDTRVVTEVDVARFVELSGLDNPIFISDEGARRAGHPTRLVPGPLLLALAMGLCQQSGLFDHVVAVMKFDDLRFLKPVRPGQSLRVKVEVIERRPTSNPQRGLVVLYYSLHGPGGEKVLSTRATYLMRTRESSPAIGRGSRLRRI